jgi:hypothetical protein
MVCSICQQAGHNRRTCTHNHDVVEQQTHQEVFERYITPLTFTNENNSFVNVFEEDNEIEPMGEEDWNSTEIMNELFYQEIQNDGNDSDDSYLSDMPELLSIDGDSDDSDDERDVNENVTQERGTHNQYIERIGGESTGEEEENEEEVEQKQTPIQNDKVYECEDCCICLEKISPTNKCTTKCGHQFCLTCLFDNINSTNDGKLDCPMCRQNVYQMDMKHSQIKRYSAMTNVAFRAVQDDFMSTNINITSTVIDLFDTTDARQKVRELLNGRINRARFERKIKSVIAEVNEINFERTRSIIDSSSSTLLETVVELNANDE